MICIVCLYFFRSVGTRSVVTYTPMTELDYGTLLCWATNKIGDQRVPCVYHIIAAGKYYNFLPSHGPW